MTQLLIIKTSNANKLKNILAKNHVEHEIIYNQVLTIKKPTKKDKYKLRERSLGSFSKLRQYIEMKSKEDIFSDYGKALQDKELESEKELLENDLD